MRIFLIVALLFTTQSGFTETLSLDAYIDNLKREDLELRRFVHQRLQTRFTKDLILPDASWLTQISQTYGISSGGTRQRTDQTQASLIKSFRDTGTNLNLSFNKNNLADRQEEVQSAQISQSLIRNPLGYQTGKLEDRIDEENKVIFLQVVESYEDYVATKIIQYLDLILAYENLKTAKRLYGDIEKLWNEVNQRKKSNIALQVDIDRATSQKLQFQRNVLEAKIDLQSLKKSLTASFSEEMSTDFLPQNEIPYINEKVELTDTFANLENQRTLKILNSREKAADYEISQQRRDLYPESQLILGFKQDESQRFSTVVNRQETVFGLSFEYSFDNTLDSAQVAQAQFNRSQVEIEKVRTGKQLKSQLSDLQQRIEIQNERVGILQRQEKVLKRLIGGEQTRFKRGRVDLETLIDTQNSYAQVQFDLISQKIQLAKYVVQWKQASDQLISDNEITN